MIIVTILTAILVSALLLPHPQIGLKGSNFFFTGPKSAEQVLSMVQRLDLPSWSLKMLSNSGVDMT